MRHAKYQFITLHWYQFYNSIKIISTRNKLVYSPELLIPTHFHANTNFCCYLRIPSYHGDQSNRHRKLSQQAQHYRNMDNFTQLRDEAAAEWGRSHIFSDVHLLSNNITLVINIPIGPIGHLSCANSLYFIIDVRCLTLNERIRIILFHFYC